MIVPYNSILLIQVDQVLHIFAPLLQNTFALYNSQSYINTTDSVFHIGFAVGNNDDPSHQEFNLIKDGLADDFLPGLPKFGPQTATNRPEGFMIVY